MFYLILLLSLIAISLIIRISPYLYLLIAGVLIVFHPFLLFKNRVIEVNYLSNIIFILILATFFLLILKKIFKLKLDFGYRKIFKYIQKNIPKFLVSFIILILIFFLPVSFFNALFILVLILGIIFKLNPRLFAGIALGFLIFYPIFLIFGKEQIADQTAILAYHLLIITAVFQIIEFIKDKKSFTP